jgi:hypothetical protein
LIGVTKKALDARIKQLLAEISTDELNDAENATYHCANTGF